MIKLTAALLLSACLLIAPASQATCPTPTLPAGWIQDGYKIEWFVSPDPECLSLALGAFEFGCYQLEGTWQEEYDIVCTTYPNETDPARPAAFAVVDDFVAGEHASLLADLETQGSACNPAP